MSDPSYQNVVIRKPVPGPRQQKAFPPAAQLKPTSNEAPNSSDNSTVSFVSLIGQMSIYTEEFSSCSRLSKFPSSTDASSSNNRTHRRHQANESDDAGCNDAATISFTEPVYKTPRSCLHQTSEVPPIPPRKHVPMNSSQQDLFNWIPPTPQSMSPATECRSRTLAHKSSLRTISQNSCLSLPRQSAFLSPALTDSVPLLQTPEPKTGASGYVPHQPKLDFLLGANGYLEMKKQSSAADYVTKAPFDDLLSPNDQIGEDDPEYFSTSELYADEPLYQVYHKGAVVRDVIEQALEDEDDVVYEDYETLLMTVLDRTSQKRAAEMGKPDVTATIDNLIPSAPGLRRFWVDTPQVKNSGILANFSSQERKHQECIFEIITSEASYLKSLKLLERHFMEDPRLKPPGSSTLSRLDYQHLFSNVKSIISVSNRLLQKLELVWKHNGVVLDAGVVCRVLKRVAEKHYGVYVPYLTNAAFQERKLSELKCKLEFQSIVTDLEDAAEVNGLKLQSFLVLPMQRITRIPLLIYAVLQGIDLEESVVDEINDCLNTFQTLLNECNEKARQMENLQQLNVLNSQLKFKKTSRTVPIVSQTRSLIKKGQLIQIKPVTKLPVQVPIRLLKTVQQKVLKEKLSARHFFLFNDLLLISKKKNDRCFEVIEFSERRNISAEIIDNRNIHNYLPSGAPSAGCNFLFCLAILDEENSEFVLSCDSENERMRWIEAFCPSSQNDEDERVYELNDCPQVQAVQKFLSEEPDELGLEESDVVNVLRKTQDGWYEGERIRDGRRGWFLASHTVEIENAHRRAKNRRQRWRLLKQTEQFQERSLT